MPNSQTVLIEDGSLTHWDIHALKSIRLISQECIQFVEISLDFGGFSFGHTLPQRNSRAWKFSVEIETFSTKSLVPRYHMEFTKCLDTEQMDCTISWLDGVVSANASALARVCVSEWLWVFVYVAYTVIRRMLAGPLVWCEDGWMNFSGGIAKPWRAKSVQ